MVQELIELPRVYVNGRAKRAGWGCMPLTAAAEGGHEEVVRVLVKRPDIDVNRKTGRGWTALMCAAWRGHVGVVRVLLEMPGTDVNSASQNGLTALSLAFSFGHMEVVEVLVAVPGVDVRRSIDQWGRTPLAVARCRKGYAHIVALLEEAHVRRLVGPLLLALLHGGVPKADAVDLAIMGLEDLHLRARAQRMRGPEPELDAF